MAVAKNYLGERELAALNNLVEQYLIFAEGQAMRRIPMRMKDWIAKLNGFLKLNDRKILDNAGKISHDLAKEQAEKEYGIYYKKSLKKRNKTDIYFDDLMNQGAKLARKTNKKNNLKRHKSISKNVIAS